MIKKHQTTIIVGVYLAFAALYNAFGNTDSVTWATLLYIADNSIIAWAVARAAQFASDTRGILFGYCFSAYKIMEIFLFLYAASISNGDIEAFWKTLDNSGAELFMLLTSLLLIWLSRLIPNF